MPGIMRETQVNGVIFGVPSTGNGISSPPHPAASTAVLPIRVLRDNITCPYLIFSAMHHSCTRYPNSLRRVPSYLERLWRRMLLPETPHMHLVAVQLVLPEG